MPGCQNAAEVRFWVEDMHYTNSQRLFGVVWQYAVETVRYLVPDKPHELTELVWGAHHSYW